MEPSTRHEPYDLDRDATVFRLIPLALEMGVPLFAICRGFQELNVALGGTLITEAQERPGSLDHRAPLDLPQDERFGLKHEVRFEGDSRLSALLDGPCIRGKLRPPPGDRPPGAGPGCRSPCADGTIEAARVAGAPAFAFGVQWHPEYWAASDAPSAALFRAFGEAARARAAGSFPLAAE
jgi:putative glutamine amidotransferase